MTNLLKFKFKHLTFSKSVLLSLGLTFLFFLIPLAIVAFLGNDDFNVNKNRDGHDTIGLIGSMASIWWMPFYLGLGLSAIVITTKIFADDVRSNVYQFLVARYGRKKVFTSNVIVLLSVAIFTSTIFSVITALIFNTTHKVFSLMPLGVFIVVFLSIASFGSISMFLQLFFKKFIVVIIIVFYILVSALGFDFINWNKNGHVVQPIYAVERDKTDNPHFVEYPQLFDYRDEKQSNVWLSLGLTAAIPFSQIYESYSTMNPDKLSILGEGLELNNITLKSKSIPLKDHPVVAYVSKDFMNKVQAANKKYPSEFAKFQEQVPKILAASLVQVVGKPDEADHNLSRLSEYEFKLNYRNDAHTGFEHIYDEFIDKGDYEYLLPYAFEMAIQKTIPMPGLLDNIKKISLGKYHLKGFFLESNPGARDDSSLPLMQGGTKRVIWVEGMPALMFIAAMSLIGITYLVYRKRNIK